MKKMLCAVFDTHHCCSLGKFIQGGIFDEKCGESLELKFLQIMLHFQACRNSFIYDLVLFYERSGI